jgi:Double zinc ribbon
MSVTQCRFCNHVNPAGSKYCSECGGALHLLPCPHCGAVSQVTATVCYQCHAQLPWHTADAPDRSSPSAAASRPTMHRRTTVIASAAVVAAIAVSGYYAYRQAPVADTAPLPVAGSTTSGSVTHADTVVIEGKIGAVDDAPAAEPEPAQIPAVSPAPVSAQPVRRSPQPARSAGGADAVKPTERSPSISPVGVATQTSSSVAACTEPVAALGLCILKPGPTGDTRTAAIKGAGAPGQALDSAKTSAGESSRQESCPEAQAALGLCRPRSSQRGN